MESLDKTDDELEHDKLVELAATVKDEQEFRERLLYARPHLRKAVYEMIKPHLKFTPRDFRKLMKHAN